MSFGRRLFLQSTLSSVASLTAFNGRLLSAETPPVAAMKDPAPKLEPPKFRDGDPDTLFLTWRRDPTTTIMAVWVAEKLPEKDVEVRCTTPDGKVLQTVKPTRHAYPADGLFVYRAEASGLKPDSQYALRIGDSKMPQRFQTMPAKATDTFQFVSGGDSGGGDDARLSNVLAARQDPKFVLMGGDIAYDNGVRLASNLRFLKNYTADLRDSSQRLIPIVPAIGNHEVATIDGKKESPFFDALYGGVFTAGSYRTLDFGDYLSLVLLDSGHMSRIEGEQTAWLAKQLAARDGLPHLIVAQHVPSYPSYRSYETTGRLSREHWVPLFQKHNVDVVLEHHDHTFKRTHPLLDGRLDKSGVVYLGDGSWGALRSLHDVEPRSYLAKTSSNYHVTLHRLEGERRFHMAMAHEGRLVDVCMTEKRPRRRVGRSA